jgi:TPR repeat protein
MVRTNKIEEYRQRAAAGDPSAQFSLAWEYFMGEFVSKDLGSAIALLRLLEETYPEVARFNIAKMKYVEDDNSLVEDLQADCAAGFGPSLYLMGSYSLKKVGGEQGRTNAIEYFRAAARNGHLPSEFLFWRHGKLGLWRRLVTAVPAFRAYLRAAVINASDDRDLRALI